MGAGPGGSPTKMFKNQETRGSGLRPFYSAIKKKKKKKKKKKERIRCGFTCSRESRH